MDGVNLLTLILACIVECKARNAGARLLRHDFQALDHAGNDFVLQARIETLGILTNDDQVDVRIARGNMRQITYRTEVRVELELLAQLHVDAGEPATHRRGDWAFQRDMRALDGFGELFRYVFAVFFKRVGAGQNGFPFELETGCFENAHY